MLFYVTITLFFGMQPKWSIYTSYFFTQFFFFLVTNTAAMNFHHKSHAFVQELNCYVHSCEIAGLLATYILIFTRWSQTVFQSNYTSLPFSISPSTLGADWFLKFNLFMADKNLPASLSLLFSPVKLYVENIYIHFSFIFVPQFDF